MTRHRSWWIIPAVTALSLQLAGCSDDPPTRPSSGGTTEQTDEQDYVLLLDDDSDPDQVGGTPGTYALTARGAATAPLAVLDVPAGFSNFGFFALWPFGSAEEGAEQAEPFRAVQYWAVHGVFTNPCTRGGEPAPRIGDSVEDLATALAAQEMTSVSEPEPVSLDGHEGLYLEVAVPTDVKLEDCDDGYYFIWEASSGNAPHPASAPGSLERTWILDVEGERIVLVAIADPGVARERVDELTDMVESVRFVEPR